MLEEWKRFRLSGVHFNPSELEHLNTDGVLDGSMKRRLLSMRTKKERGPEIVTNENSVLINDLLDDDRKSRLANASKIGRSYWRHVSEDVEERDANRTMNFENILNPSYAFEQAKSEQHKSVEGVGMGMELTCLSTFLTHGAANKALKSYFLDKRNSVRGGSYTATGTTGTTLSLSSSNFASNGEPARIESDGLNNDNVLRITADPYADLLSHHEVFDEGSNASNNANVSDASNDARLPSHSSDAERLKDHLFDLASDIDPRNRQKAAEDERTPIEAMWVLMADEDIFVRLKVAQNPNCPVPALELLCDDINKHVARAAQTGLRQAWARQREGIAVDRDYLPHLKALPGNSSEDDDIGTLGDQTKIA